MGPVAATRGAPGADPLAPWLAERLGVELVDRSPVRGGCIHSAWCLRLADGSRLFAKTNAASSLPLLEAEAGGLRALAAAASEAGLRLPEPLALGALVPMAVLVLSWLDLGRGSGDGTAEPWRRTGAALARLHRHSLSLRCSEADRPGQAFGWVTDNYIGTSPQANGWEGHWGRFFVERRLVPQLARLASKGVVLGGADALLGQASGWIDGHHPDPCLVHGDLWSGNAAVTHDGVGAIFDPAVYRGDREVDLAMASLFGGFPAAFFRGYQEEWPLPDGHERRADLYNLYHLLNHANLFGGSYRDQCQDGIDRLMRR
ncbi:MAG: fructosamine kinase [Cyanobium sp. CACIAM 14]|nr:MAG: fructosamine kinase [Cyanobium sp. CACIAM 14]